MPCTVSTARWRPKKLYGENLSYGFLDKIGQMFGYLNTTNNDTEILNYDYTNNTVRSTIDNIWTSQYQAISYVNNVLGNLDQLNSSDESLRLVRGEAYGLRAFLHFDLLRLYCPDYRQQPEAQYGLPYPTLSTWRTRRSTRSKEPTSASSATWTKRKNISTTTRPWPLSKVAKAI